MTCFWCGLHLAKTHHAEYQMAEHLRAPSGARQGLFPLVCKGPDVANIPAIDIFEPIVLLYSVLRSSHLKARVIISIVRRCSSVSKTVVRTVLMAIEWEKGDMVFAFTWNHQSHHAIIFGCPSQASDTVHIVHEPIEDHTLDSVRILWLQDYYSGRGA